MSVLKLAKVKYSPRWHVVKYFFELFWRDFELFWSGEIIYFNKRQGGTSILSKTINVKAVKNIQFILFYFYDLKKNLW